MNILVAFVGVLFFVAGVLLFVAQRLGIVGLLAFGAILIGLRKRQPEVVRASRPRTRQCPRGGFTPGEVASVRF
jgi:hypothetical protein